MDVTCPLNPHTNRHFWLEVDEFEVCVYCEAEVPIRLIATVETKGGYL